jgi:hypothetical protein
MTSEHHDARRFDAQPLSRRAVLGGGLAALTLGTARGAGAWPCLPAALGNGAASPMVPAAGVGTVERIGGLPFARWFTGDDFRDSLSVPFHGAFNKPLPAPTERVPIAIVGGGLAGLTAAYMTRDLRPVVFDLRPRFGGNALGEAWEETRYSLGSAYVIVPDPGSALERLYLALGVQQRARVSLPPDPVEVGGVIEGGFWTGAGLSPAEQRVFQRYAEVVAHMAEHEYPEIPLTGDPVVDAGVRRLDTSTFRADLERRMGVRLTPRLAAAVQAYFYTSFGAGMDEISAASGWNFVAAEEYGRLVFPGGNAGLATALWEALARAEMGPGNPSRMLRPGCAVIDVRRTGEWYRVTWREPDGAFRALEAQQVICAGSKPVLEHMLRDVDTLDPRKFAAMQRIETLAYVVANVLLDAPVHRDFYDLFMVRDELAFPMTPEAFEQASRPTDVVNGNFALAGDLPRSVMTFYWPLAYGRAREDLLAGDPWRTFAEGSVETLRHGLGLLGVPDSAVRQVRLTRFGHALPRAAPGFIADSWAEALVRPFDGAVHFANQDNWALPAVENALLDAMTAAERVRGTLR